MKTGVDRSWDDEDSYGDVDDYGDSVNDDEEPMVECANCGCEMLEIVLQCPRCGDYASKESPLRSSHPRWVLLTAILCLGAMLYLWLF